MHTVTSISSLHNKHSHIMDSNPENEIAEMVFSKNDYPNEKVLSKTSLVKDFDNDITYLLSKLTDNELIKLLNSQPKKTEYDLNYIVRILFDPKAIAENKQKLNEHTNEPQELVANLLKENNNFKLDGRASQNNVAFFRLEDKRVDPFNTKSNNDFSNNAAQKFNNLLYSYPQNQDSVILNSGENIDKKELLFDVLVSQLKSLCCKKSKSYRSRASLKHYQKSKLDKLPKEYIFLIVNEEIKSNGSDDLVTVDPDSLQKNSSVLLLGPITTPLSNDQLKLIINRISRELSSPEYLPLLQQLSDGSLNDENSISIKNIITGPATRRYIKPHRCNHQSKLTQIYGGPKWLICTGYLNLNVPSLYD